MKDLELRIKNELKKKKDKDINKTINKDYIFFTILKCNTIIIKK